MAMWGHVDDECGPAVLIRYKEVVEAAVSRMQSEMQALKAERVGQAHTSISDGSFGLCSRHAYPVRC